MPRDYYRPSKLVANTSSQLDAKKQTCDLQDIPPYTMTITTMTYNKTSVYVIIFLIAHRNVHFHSLSHITRMISTNIVILFNIKW